MRLVARGISIPCLNRRSLQRLILRCCPVAASAPCETLFGLCRATAHCKKIEGRLSIQSPLELKQSSQSLIVVHNHMQVGRRDAHVRVTYRISDLGQSAAACQRVANERVPTVMDRKGFESLAAQDLAGSAEPLAKCVA